MSGFRNQLRTRAQTLDVKQRRQILRLLVKEILVGFDALTIRHSIPIPPGRDLHTMFLVLPLFDKPVIFCVPGAYTPVLAKHEVVLARRLPLDRCRPDAAQL